VVFSFLPWLLHEVFVAVACAHEELKTLPILTELRIYFSNKPFIGYDKLFSTNMEELSNENVNRQLFEMKPGRKFS
jgi:hypothetical protein